MRAQQTPGYGLGGSFEVFWTFLLLGLTSFGGPAAHLGYFRTAFVERRRWLSDADYADLVALCQFLPGPASTQVGMAIGKLRAGYAGAIAAWLGFTLPSAAVMLAVAWGVGWLDGDYAVGLVHGLKLAAVAVVLAALVGMARSLTPDLPRIAIAATAALAAHLLPHPLVQPAIILLAALGGALLPAPHATAATVRVATGLAPLWLALFVVLLVALPVLASIIGDHALAIADIFYRTGSLVFGGGHAVLPLLEGELVPALIDRDTFLAGYGAAQALPGPLFAFSAYAGARLSLAPNGMVGGLIALVAIFLPAMLLVLGALPYWQQLRTIPRLRHGLDTANAAVVGLLAAAFAGPVVQGTISDPIDVVLALTAFALLIALRLSPVVVVLGLAAVGSGLAAL